MRYEEEDTGIFVLIAIWVMVIVSIFMCIRSNTEEISIYVLLGFGMLMTLFYLPTYNKTKKIVKNNNEIKEKGQRIPGEIIDYSSNVTRSGDSHDWHYTVTVKYTDPYTKQEKTYTTPDLNFNPIQSLGSKTCTVYVLNEQIYVSDFVKREKDQENIWDASYTNLEKREAKKITVGIILFVLFFIAIVLWGFSQVIFQK